MPAQSHVRQATHRYASLATGAEYAHCSIKTLRRRTSDGSLTGFRMGPRLIRVDLNELDALLRPIPTAGDAALLRPVPAFGTVQADSSGEQYCSPDVDAELTAGGGAK